MEQKNLTKSLAMTGLQCPRKLYYHTHPEIYQNEKVDDSFLQALAEGGFQVGALAKIYHPDGIDLSGLYPSDAIIRTKELLNQNSVTIFEAAFIHENLLVRVDVLRKDGNNVNLLEVKAKSYDSNKDSFFDKKTQTNLVTKWEKYLWDLAYQTYVCGKAMPELSLKPHLYLIDKNSIASTDGLNQRFRLFHQNEKTKVEILDGTDMDSVGQKILIEIDASRAVDFILQNNFENTKKTNWWDKLPFEKKIIELSNGLKSDQKLNPRLDSKCKKCEFRCSPTPPLKSGFKECWATKVENSELNEAFIFDVWRYAAKSDAGLNAGKILMKELSQDDFAIKEKTKTGLTWSERQWLQVTSSINNQKYFDKVNFLKEIEGWTYPLHFIDFETSRVALPFNAGKKPYEQIAFQFSHHTVYENGKIEQTGQYIDDVPGNFPNFDFVRNLKYQLEHDNGTIFRYSNHENAVLCDILKQLQYSNEQDKDILIEWIKTITKKDKQWSGSRNMVDLCDLVINYFYHPLMKDSNSLKCVLPTILQDSKQLQEKYKLPIYGSDNGIKSLNFENWVLVQYDQNGKIKDPYQLLPKLFDDIQTENLDTLFDEDEITQGGAAMTAYAKMQFTEMSELERQQLRSGLLKYCELDTFAMVLLYEYFLEQLS